VPPAPTRPARDNEQLPRRVGVVVDEPVEACVGEDQTAELGRRPHRRRPWPAVDRRERAEAVAGPDGPHLPPADVDCSLAGNPSRSRA
jgi:hypothetical protein